MINLKKYLPFISMACFICSQASDLDTTTEIRLISGTGIARVPFNRIDREIETKKQFITKYGLTTVHKFPNLDHLVANHRPSGYFDTTKFVIHDNYITAVFPQREITCQVTSNPDGSLSLFMLLRCGGTAQLHFVSTTDIKDFRDALSNIEAEELEEVRPLFEYSQAFRVVRGIPNETCVLQESLNLVKVVSVLDEAYGIMTLNSLDRLIRKYNNKAIYLELCLFGSDGEYIFDVFKPGLLYNHQCPKGQLIKALQIIGVCTKKKQYEPANQLMSLNGVNAVFDEVDEWSARLKKIDLDLDKRSDFAADYRVEQFLHGRTRAYNFGCCAAGSLLSLSILTGFGIAYHLHTYLNY